MKPRNGDCSSTIERFTLSGPSAKLDPRYNAYRGDLADAALASCLFAPHYARPVARSVIAETQIRMGPATASEAMGGMQVGEAFALLDITGQWAWGYREADHLVGYVEVSRLSQA